MENQIVRIFLIFGSVTGRFGITYIGLAFVWAMAFAVAYAPAALQVAV